MKSRMLFLLVFLAGVGGVFTPARADRLAASCAAILNIGGAEADFLYYEAEADLGSEKATRLWNGFHRLKYRCAGNPGAKFVVDVSPAVKAFLESHR